MHRSITRSLDCSSSVCWSSPAHASRKLEVSPVTATASLSQRRVSGRKQSPRYSTAYLATTISAYPVRSATHSRARHRCPEATRLSWRLAYMVPSILSHIPQRQIDPPAPTTTSGSPRKRSLRTRPPLPTTSKPSRLGLPRTESRRARSPPTTRSSSPRQSPS